MAAGARVIDRKNTGFPTVGQTDRELLLGGADMCIAVHSRIAACPVPSTVASKPCETGYLPTGLRTCTRSPGGSSEGIQDSGKAPCPCTSGSDHRPARIDELRQTGATSSDNISSRAAIKTFDPPKKRSSVG